MPDAGRSYYTNAKHLRHARWEDAIIFDLPRDVESRFPVLLGREHRGIAGISMGGYGAVKLALKHPELYGFAGTMSGALDITRRPASLRRLGKTLHTWAIFGVRPGTRQSEDVFTLLDRASMGEIQSVKWFLSCGKSDPLYAVNARFVREVSQRGIKLDWITTPGFHDWQSWNAAMPLLFKAAGAALR
jgi:S-formylglutathione hydrolase FrmB